MSTTSLPEHPDLDQLRRQAKELLDAARSGDPVALERIAAHAPGERPQRLATAQLVLAREHGFASWPKLRAEVIDRTAGLAELIDAFLYESVAGRDDRPVRLLREHPSITTQDFRAAVVSGDADALRPMLVGDPGLATRPDRRTGWPPLLGVCMSRWHHLDPVNLAAGLCEVARLLLDAGADPNTTVGGRPGRREYCSTLFAAAGVQANAELTELLLDRGATPDAHTVYLAAFHADHRPLELLLERGAPVDDTALAAPLTTGDAEVTRLLLAAGADAARLIPPAALGVGDPGDLPVPVAVRNGHSAELVELLLTHGGDASTPGRDGQPPYRLAVRQGRRDLADLLARYGASEETTDVDDFLDACLRADRAEAKRRVAADPGLLDRLTDADRAAVHRAADNGDADAVRLLLDVGFPVNSHDGDNGATPLHVAAGAGSVDVVRLLLDRGADVAARDTTWDSTPAVWASVGSGMHLGHTPAPDWVTTIELLISAGASVADAWLTGFKAPSPEVADLLRAHGVTEPSG